MPGETEAAFRTRLSDRLRESRDAKVDALRKKYAAKVVAQQERVRKADRAFTRAKIDAKNRFDAFIFGTWNLTGVSRRRKANQILADLSTRRSTWNIEIREGMGFTTEKLTEEQAIAILNGEMKIGWEDDRMAMTSLNQALIDFRMMRLKAQNEEKAFRKNVIQFQRLTSRGTPGPLVASDLEMLYFLQLCHPS
jgi:hypothetical protein